MEEKDLSFSVTIGEKELYRFLLYSVYHSLQGFSAVFVSVMAILLLILTWENSNIAMKLLLLLLGLYYVAIKPLTLKAKAKMQSMQEVFSKPLSFTVREDALEVSQGEEKVILHYSDILKLVSRKEDIYLYTGRLYAYIIPKNQTGEKWKELMTEAEKNGCRIV